MAQKPKNLKTKFDTAKKQSKAYSRLQVKKLKTTVKKTGTVIKTVPEWVKSRPHAFREWKKADKKKKKYRSFHLQKKIKPEPRFIPSVSGLLKLSWQFFRHHKKILFSIFLIHVLIYYLFARTPQNFDISTIQNSVKDAFGGESSSLSANVVTLGAVLGLSGGSQSNKTAITLIAFSMSLVYVWAIRKLSSNEPFKARDAYYQAFGPIIPVVMIMIVMSLQLIPFAAASFVYTTARTSGTFATGIEDFSVFVFAAFCGLLSFYLMTSTIISLYIVTLPGMRPINALRAAKKLVQFQRFTVFKRIIGLPIMLGIVYLAILFIFVRFIPGKVLFIAEISQILVLPFIHIYLYKLYRSLI
jgi:hypothetical protein